MFRSTLIAVVAILAVTGTTATAATLITGKQIKNGSVNGADIKNRSLGAGELTRAAQASLRGQKGADGANGAPGAKGDKGDTGAAGAKGDNGDRGPSNAFSTRVPAALIIDGPTDSRKVIGGTLPSGSYVITAKVVVENNGPANDRPLCRLGVMRGLQFEALDRVDPLIGNVDPIKEQVLTLMGTTSVDGATNEYLVECEPQAGAYSLRFRDRSLIAIQVATLED
jgi:hypothetical protein